MSVPDQVFDLRQLRKNLPAKYGRLGRSIDRWIAAHSVHSDLSIAHSHVTEALYLHRLGRQSITYAPVALLHSSVVAYARSLERHSEHRGAIKLGEAFSPEQAAFHAQLIEIRDDSLAHFGPAGPDKPIAEDYAVVMYHGPFYQPGIMSRRGLFNKQFTERLLRHLKESMSLVAAIAERRQAEFRGHFDQFLEVDPAANELLQTCMFDQSKLAGAAEYLLRVQPPGRQTLISPGE